MQFEKNIVCIELLKWKTLSKLESLTTSRFLARLILSLGMVSKGKEMQETKIKTGLGEICVAIEEKDSTSPPIIFMHGVFLDKSLWHEYPAKITQKTHIYIDMPAHGKTSDVGRDWDIDDCISMLIQIMDTLNVKTCFLIGHSWGSMTALRAAVRFPDRFEALGLFNMPYRKTTGLRSLGFTLQKAMLAFPRFYAKQAAKSLYSGEILRNRPELSIQMQDRLSKRPQKEISRVIDAVILMPDDAIQLINELRVPALAVIGREDYVGKPPRLETWTVPGGHISPHESVEKVKDAIIQVIGMRN